MPAPCDLDCSQTCTHGRCNRKIKAERERMEKHRVRVVTKAIFVNNTLGVSHFINARLDF